VIQENKVVIVDEATGRLMPDREWRDGLHQAVSAKEGVEVQPPKVTLARVSFQRFFRMYRRLSGMTGTAWEERRELWQTYATPTAPIPTYRPIARTLAPDKVLATEDEKWAAVADAVEAGHATGRPVLVGTRSVGASETLSTLLTERNVPHAVLNAVRHEEEAQVVSEAGMKGRVTIATNMAGRGTDIKLGPHRHRPPRHPPGGPAAVWSCRPPGRPGQRAHVSQPRRRADPPAQPSGLLAVAFLAGPATRPGPRAVAAPRGAQAGRADGRQPGLCRGGVRRWGVGLPWMSVARCQDRWLAALAS